jgi:tryptophan-rich sensory protein
MTEVLVWTIIIYFTFGAFFVASVDTATFTQEDKPDWKGMLCIFFLWLPALVIIFYEWIKKSVSESRERSNVD